MSNYWNQESKDFPWR